MSHIYCPVCTSINHQSFWFWEKEEKLVRSWAMDTRVHFSICRDCALIFQNPLVHSPAAEDFSFTSWGVPQELPVPPIEPLDWMQQFTKRGKEPTRALEVYFRSPRFQEKLQSEGWEIQAVQVDALLNSTDSNSIETLAEGEEFPLIFCFDALDKVSRPMDLLERLHRHLSAEGGMLIEVSNPYVAPRIHRTCLTSDECCVFPFHTLIFSLYKAGFTNHSAEIWGKNRCFCTKIEPNLNADATKLVPSACWSQIESRFHRNYSWIWVTGFLDRYLKQLPYQPDLMNQTRELLRQRPEELHLIRDVCGAVLLFVNEIDTVRQTLSEDWSLTMNRIFEVLGKDYALFDLLQTAAPIPALGTLAEIERFYFNEKMIFMANQDYFSRFFTQEDAALLCQGIIASGGVVCKTLSSFL